MDKKRQTKESDTRERVNPKNISDAEMDVLKAQDKSKCTEEWLLDLDKYCLSLKKVCNTQREFLELVQRRYSISNLDKFLRTYWGDE